MTASSSTLQKSAILLLTDFGRKRSVRHRMMSGEMPTVRSSFTECCTGFVLSSPAVAM
jgi:hypothetical protein